MMKDNWASSTYVVFQRMKLEGVITMDIAIKGNNENLNMRDVIIRDLITTSSDNLSSDIIRFATEARFPIAVADENRSLKGIMSNAYVLAFLM